MLIIITNGVQVFSLSCDDYWLVVGLNNGLVRIFQIATSQLIAELDCKGAVSCAKG